MTWTALAYHCADEPFNGAERVMLDGLPGWCLATGCHGELPA